MSKFKVGDKIRVISNEHRPRHHFKAGTVATVLKVDSNSVLCEEDSSSKLEQWVNFLDAELAPLPQKQKIVVTTDGKTTTARLFAGKELVKSATAKCAPADKFDFKIGAGIAVSRLLSTEEEPAAPKFPREKLKTGVFGRMSESDRWFVVVGDSIIYQAGGFDHLYDVNADGNLGPYWVDCIVDACSFGDARAAVREANFVWSRPGAKFD